MAGQGGVIGWLRAALSPGRPATSGAGLPLPAGVGPLVWMRIGAGYDQPGPTPGELPATLVQLLAQLRRKGMQVVVSRAEGGPVDVATRGVTAIPEPDSPAALASHLEAMNPAAILLIGPELPRPLITAASQRAIPVILAEARLSAPTSRWTWPRARARGRMTGLTRLLLPDAQSRRAALRMGAPAARTEATGPITLTHEPLGYLEAEREVLAEALSGRQIWLAVAATRAEYPALIEAQLDVLRYSHRALLVAVPADPTDIDAMAAAMESAGLVVAQRARDEDPTDEVDVYLADDPFELGLWYRLAALCVMGSTLAGPTDSARNPFEAAALGSAMIHGPQTGPFGPEWARLDAARAASPISGAAELSGAVLRLMSPDQAAILASNAWCVATGGAGVVARIAEVLREEIEKREMT